MKEHKIKQRGINIFFIVAICFLLFWLIFCAVKIDKANNKIEEMETGIVELKASYEELNSQFLTLKYSYDVLSKNVADISDEIDVIQKNLTAVAAMLAEYQKLFESTGAMFSTISDYMTTVNTELKLIEAMMAQAYGSNWKTIAAYYIINGG